MSRVKAARPKRADRRDKKTYLHIEIDPTIKRAFKAWCDAQGRTMVEGLDHLLRQNFGRQ